MINKLFSKNSQNNHIIITLFGIKFKFKQKKLNTNMKPINIKGTLTEPIGIKNCQLCDNTQYYKIKDYTINNLKSFWISQYNINPFDNCYENEILELRECKHCHLEYYNYKCPDYEQMYELLYKKQPYSPFKWDYDIGLSILKKYNPQSCLDIGCGYGYFLDKIKNSIPYVQGTEFNSEALNVCKNKNLNVFPQDLKKINRTFDFISAFQVLEHISNPKEFLLNCINLLNPNGILCIVVPNPESVALKYCPGILELPPHHCVNYYYKTFEYIAKSFDLSIVDYIKEPLAFNIYNMYLQSLNITTRDIYSNYLQEKDKLAGKSHLICFRKVNDN